MEHETTNTAEEASAVPTRRGSNQSGMRAYNERLVLTLIRQHGAMAKAEIARRTELSAQTVSVIMRALESDGLLVRGEPIRGRIGQPSVPMHLATDGAFFFGLKVGRRSVDLILTDFLGRVQHRIGTSHPYPTPDQTVSFATDAIGTILSRLKPDQRERIAGLGIAMPFQLWDWAQTFGVGADEIRGWKDRDIAAEIEAACEFPVFVCNDASTACGAELVFGDQNRPDDFLYFFVGFFVGGGLVLDGGLYTGRSGNAAALGSMLVRAADGTTGQLVDMASLASLEQTLAETGKRDSMSWDDPERWTIPDGTLVKWAEGAAHGIAQAIMSSACLIDVEHVLIDGWMPAKMRTMLVELIAGELDRITIAGVQKPKVREGTIGPDARALGAASLPLSNRFLVERNSYQKGPSK